MYISKDPFRGVLLEEYPFATQQEMDCCLQQSSHVYDHHWSKLKVVDRMAFLPRLAHLLRSQVEELARVLTEEMGKPISQARSEVLKCARLCDYYAETAEQHLQDQLTSTSDGRPAAIIFQPLGAVLGVMPWNFPYWQVMRFAVPALVAGNVVLLKPAPNVPRSASVLQDLFTQAIGQSDIFQSLFLSNEQTAELIGHPHVCGVALTGSDRAGSIVAATAGKYLKPSVMELGGADPLIVLADADLETAAEVALRSRMNNNGQTCIAAKRILVEQTVAEPFAHALQTVMERLVVGDPMEDTTYISTLARPDLKTQLQSQLDRCLAEGAQILHRSGPTTHPGSYFQPTLLGELRPGMLPEQEELFGPIATLWTTPDAKTAIDWANGTPYGLGASLWTSDLERGRQLARQLQTGSVTLNGMTSSDVKLPFGGVKRSGYGRELGPDGLLAFVNRQVLVG